MKKQSKAKRQMRKDAYKIAFTILASMEDVRFSAGRPCEELFEDKACLDWLKPTSRLVCWPCRCRHYLDKIIKSINKQLRKAA